MLILDAILPDYDADPIVLALVLGTGATLLGIEAGDILRGGRP